MKGRYAQGQCLGWGALGLGLSLLALGSGWGSKACALPRVEARAVPPASASLNSLEERLNRLEDRLGDSLQGDLLNQLSGLQQEVQELRGTLEVQEHELKRLRQAQETIKTPPRAAALPKEANKAKVETVTLIPLNNPKALEESPQALTESTLLEAAQRDAREKQWLEAEKKYTEHLSRFPESNAAALVHYGLGEIYWTQWHQEKTDALLLEKALQAYTDVVTGFQDHPKAKDALLKLGLIELEKGNWKVGAEHFRKVMALYPNSPSAKIAELRIQKLVQEGRIS